MSDSDADFSDFGGYARDKALATIISFPGRNFKTKKYRCRRSNIRCNHLGALLNALLKIDIIGLWSVSTVTSLRPYTYV